ncbi:hypothetical protein QAD02_011378 [Eretmocerus hayati]|uniref:Uncharacterized protein n=1 Tax=Eretmocerus hayati TaxID=131215 RepID=A0ACC2NWV1_9HYME|nr:hypothetical protein QAD02_011378 [Eretmocerus hayati]
MNSTKSLHRRSPLIGGRNAAVSDFPYFVAVEFLQIQICGGSIVSNKFVLTAAHCFELSNKTDAYKIRSGTEIEGKGGMLHSLVNFEKHPSFREDGVGGLFNDIALARIEQIFKFDQFRQRINLFAAGEKCEDKTIATIVGFSIRKYENSHRLSSTTIRIVSHSYCNASWIHLDGSPIPDTVLCAGVANGSRDTCGGDSGGPLIIDKRLAGITSFGVDCGTYSLPSVYTEVASFRQWIDDRITPKRRFEYNECKVVNS